jgi:hypothetical protein
MITFNYNAADYQNFQPRKRSDCVLRASGSTLPLRSFDAIVLLCRWAPSAAIPVLLPRLPRQQQHTCFPPPLPPPHFEPIFFSTQLIVDSLFGDNKSLPGVVIIEVSFIFRSYRHRIWIQIS